MRSGTALEDVYGDQARQDAAVGFGPYDTVVWLLVVGFLEKIESRKEAERHGSYAEQRCNDSIVEIFLHGGGSGTRGTCTLIAMKRGRSAV